MDENTRKKLEEPFPAELIKTRPGSNGKNLSYVEVAEYVRRLNDVFQGNWSFEVVDQAIGEKEVWVLGRLSVNGVTKSSYGNSKIRTSRVTGEQISIGEELKSSESDSLKRCCRLLGIGLHLYSDKQHDEPITHTRDQGGNGGNGNGRSRSNGNHPTPRQLQALWSYGRKANYTADEIRGKSFKMFSRSPENLSRSEASTLIQTFSDMLNH